MNTAKNPKRIIAYFIDMAIAITPTIFLAIYIYYYVSVTFNYSISWYFLFVGVLISKWVVYVFINTLFLLLSNGRTLGNAIFGIKYVHSDFKRISFKDALCISSVHGLLTMMIISFFYVLLVQTERSVADRLTTTIAVDWRHRNI